MKKISFLVPAHNEEKIIEFTLANLAKIPYDNYEVIIGLDGCTDKTEEIVKKYCRMYKKIKYYSLNIREGKPAVVDNIIKKASGDIIIINDADWIFKFGDRKKLKDFISVFDDDKIGGIAEAFPVEWNNKIKNADVGYKMVAYSSYYWFNFQKESFSYTKDELNYIKEPSMFLTNVFRKTLYKGNTLLGDDFERTYDIMNLGYNVVLFNDIKMPRMTAVYDNISIKNLFKQKIRTARAREQMMETRKWKVDNKYYISSLTYMLKNAWMAGLNKGFYVSSWIALTSLASLFAKFSKMNTKEGWKLRAR